LINFTEEYLAYIFGERRPSIFLFRAESDKGSDFEKVFEETAHKNKGSIVFAVSDVTSSIQQRLGDFIGVKAEMLPTIRILSDQMDKYIFPHPIKEMTVAQIEQFI